MCPSTVAEKRPSPVLPSAFPSSSRLTSPKLPAKAAASASSTAGGGAVRYTAAYMIGIVAVGPAACTQRVESRSAYTIYECSC